MINKKEILEEVDRLSGLREMVESYEEIAASRMRRIRDSVLKTREFLSGINQIFHQVQLSYKDEVLRLMKHKKIKDPSKITYLKRNGKTVYVLLSANTGLYGSIIRSTFNLFLENIKKEACDVVIIGKLGKAMFEDEKLNVPMTSFDFPDNVIDYEIFRKIIEHILQYEKIVVFHGQFQTVITQKPAMSNISDNQLQEEEVDTISQNKKIHIKYLFEPSLEKIMAFFETEIFSSIFEQTLHESHLAKFSSRMVVLDSAVENIKNKITKVNLEWQRLKHRSGNRKQLGRLSGMSLWGKTL